MAVLACPDRRVIGKIAAEASILEDDALVGEVAVKPLAEGSLFGSGLQHVCCGITRSWWIEMELAVSALAEERAANVVARPTHLRESVVGRGDDSNGVARLIDPVQIRRYIAVWAAANIDRIKNQLRIARRFGKQALGCKVGDDRQVGILSKESALWIKELHAEASHFLMHGLRHSAGSQVEDESR